MLWMSSSNQSLSKSCLRMRKTSWSCLCHRYWWDNLMKIQLSRKLWRHTFSLSTNLRLATPNMLCSKNLSILPLILKGILMQPLSWQLKLSLTWRWQYSRIEVWISFSSLCASILWLKSLSNSLQSSHLFITTNWMTYLRSFLTTLTSAQLFF